MGCVSLSWAGKLSGESGYTYLSRAEKLFGASWEASIDPVGPVLEAFGRFVSFFSMCFCYRILL